MTDATTQRSLAGTPSMKAPKGAQHAVRSAAIAIGLAALIPGAAIAGPPFMTDDPEPVDYQHYEFYTFTTGTAVSGDTSGVGPAWEYNYGIIPNGQIHLIAPLAFDSPS